MARPSKNGVDYFSHDTSSGKTIFTLESKFGNDGYAFWFKLLETLGSQDTLSLDCNNLPDWEYLIAKTRVSEVTATEILDTLSRINAIDFELWSKKIIWVQKFADRLTPVFRKRHTEIPIKPSFCDRNTSITEDSVEISTQRKGKERKGKESKGKEIYVPYETIVERFNDICHSLSKVASITDKRKDKIKKRWSELKSIDAFEKLFYLTEESDFLCGREKEWKANFDWLMMNDTNYIKVIEGNYGNKITDKPKGNYLDEVIKEGMQSESNRYGKDYETDPVTVPRLLQGSR
jgi:hypothetical protein